MIFVCKLLTQHVNSSIFEIPQEIMQTYDLVAWFQIVTVHLLSEFYMNNMIPIFVTGTMVIE